MHGFRNYAVGQGRAPNQIDAAVTVPIPATLPLPTLVRAGKADLVPEALGQP
jgi:hypothetical protein